MSRYAMDGKIRVTFAPAVANKAAPTTVELAAGTELSTWITKDGLKLPTNQNMVPDTSLAEVFDSEVVGSYGGPVNITGKRDDVPANDTAWNLFTYGLTGFIVVRRGPLVTVGWAAAQKAMVFPIMSHHPVPVDSATNEQDRFTVLLAVTSEPSLKATVA